MIPSNTDHSNHSSIYLNSFSSNKTIQSILICQSNQLQLKTIKKIFFSRSFTSSTAKFEKKKISHTKNHRDDQCCDTKMQTNPPQKNRIITSSASDGMLDTELYVRTDTMCMGCDFVVGWRERELLLLVEPFRQRLKERYDRKIIIIVVMNDVANCNVCVSDEYPCASKREYFYIRFSMRVHAKYANDTSTFCCIEIITNKFNDKNSSSEGETVKLFSVL